MKNRRGKGGGLSRDAFHANLSPTDSPQKRKDNRSAIFPPHPSLSLLRFVPSASSSSSSSDAEEMQVTSLYSDWWISGEDPPFFLSSLPLLSLKKLEKREGR
ncbi:hypothetical protein AVEN_99963-1 [Araneus ventricosus]|uniref:Uncharacterized protein n=1 Tax=Araneus ventricosus TaxID=182803 RepID=A0A4Y2N0I3_ARAVE|nr:hypothetical protein AVEN_99963-1 [Araneus ventricosus]